MRRQGPAGGLPLAVEAAWIAVGETFRINPANILLNEVSVARST
jgi:hypothetical protein